MKKLAAVLCLFGFLSFVWAVSAAAAPPAGIEARAAVLMDAATGQVLYDKNGAESLEPASITKILTALVALERLPPDEPLIAGAGAVNIPSWASSAGLLAGEQLTLKQALYALMLPSGNDAAAVIAEAVSGSQQAFAQLMNERAASLGAASTHFTNSSGLPDPEHRTTARDMALITRQALECPGFPAYFSAAEYQMEATNLSEARTFHNTHRMLRPDSPEYEPAVIGGKTGYTDSAGHTLVTAAQREGRTLICVVLHSDRYYQDTQELLDYGFTGFSPHVYSFQTGTTRIPLMNGEQEAGFILFSRPCAVSLLLPDETAPQQVMEDYSLPQNPQSLQASVQLLLPSGEGGGTFPTLSIPLQAESVALLPAAQQALSSPAAPNKADVQPHALWQLLLVAAGGMLAGAAAQHLLSALRARRRTAPRLRKGPRNARAENETTV